MLSTGGKLQGLPFLIFATNPKCDQERSKANRIRGKIIPRSEKLKLMSCNIQVSSGSTEQGFLNTQPNGWGRENKQMQVTGKCQHSILEKLASP